MENWKPVIDVLQSGEKIVIRSRGKAIGQLILKDDKVGFEGWPVLTPVINRRILESLESEEPEGLTYIDPNTDA